jgi:hypothetical protein
MISNTRVDRRHSLANFLHKKSSVRSTSVHDQNGTKKKTKNEKNLSERKKRTKTKKKRKEHSNLNNNNNNNALMTDNSLMSFTSENRIILPQVGYSSRAEIEHTKYIRGPKHQVFYRRANGFRTQMRQLSSIEQEFPLEKHSHFVNHSYPQSVAF